MSTLERGLDSMRHALGLDWPARRGSCGVHRNHYVVGGPEHAASAGILRVVEEGWMEVGRTPDTYHVTAAGCRALGLNEKQRKAAGVQP